MGRFKICLSLSIMIGLTRLNGKKFTINALFIETVESFPDTTITLTNGHKYVVRDTEQEVFYKIIEFYREINVLSIRKDREVLQDE